MGLGYRSVLRLEPKNSAVKLAESEFDAWLKSKNLSNDIWHGPAEYQVGKNATVRISHLDTETDKSVRRSYRLIEQSPAGQFESTIIAISAPLSRGHQETLIVEIAKDGLSLEESIFKIDRPRIVEKIIKGHIAFDGSTELTGEPRLIRVGEIDVVINAILDQERIGSVIVASSVELETEGNWLKIVTSLTRESIGIATIFVISAEATKAFNEHLPTNYKVEPGQVRTFAPMVDWDSLEDSFRHRLLGPISLARSISSRNHKVAEPLVKRHAQSTRQRIIQTPLDPVVRRSIDLLEGAERRIRIASLANSRVQESLHVQLVEEPPQQQTSLEVIEIRSKPEITLRSETSVQAPEGKLWLRITNVIRRWLGKDAVSLETIEELDRTLELKTEEISVSQELLDEAALRISAIDAQLSELRENNVNAEYEALAQSEEAQKLFRQNAYLRGQLAKYNDFATEAPIDDDELWASPQDIEELIARITEGEEPHFAFNRVIFTGDKLAAIEIQKIDQTGRYAKAFWEHIRVLYTYSELKERGEFSGNVHIFLTSPSSSGFKVPAERHSPGESESVNNNPAWRKERVFSVPTSVRATGEVEMMAHFKPTFNNRIAPRLHYFDDTANSGKIFIGYIGKHLTNTKT